MPFRLDEQIAEGRMRPVGRARREHDLAIAGELDVAGDRTVVRHRHAPHFSGVFRDDDDFHARLDVAVSPAHGHPVGREMRMVRIGDRSGRLMPGGPHVLPADIADIAELPRVIARAVGTPAGDGEILELTVPAPGVRDHHVQRSVPEECHMRAGRCHGRILANDRACGLRHSRGGFGGRRGQ